MAEVPVPEIGHASPQERQQWILDYMLQNGSVDLDFLCRRYQVSRMTVHRDLDELGKSGVLRRVRGGATVLPTYLFESDIRYRMRSATREKEALARHALSLIETGQAIMVDDSTTALALASLLPSVKPITVITNCLGVITLLKEERQINLISLGGEYLPSFDAFTGLICEDSIGSLRANLLFMSTSAISNCVAYHQNQQVIKVKRAMMNSAARKILMVDNSKFGKAALHRLAPLQEFDLVLTDSGTGEDQLKALEDARIRFDIVPSSTS